MSAHYVRIGLAVAAGCCVLGFMPGSNESPARAAGPVATSIAVGSNPQGIAVDPTRNLIYVANHDSDSVSVIDGRPTR